MFFNFDLRVKIKRIIKDFRIANNLSPMESIQQQDRRAAAAS